MREGGRKRKRVYTGHSCCDIFRHSHAFCCPLNGGEPARTTGPLARQRKTHAAFSPGLKGPGQGGDPRDTRKTPLPATARASPLGIDLLRGLEGGEAEGGGSVALVSRIWCSCGLPGRAALEGGGSRIVPGLPRPAPGRGPSSRAPGWSPGSRGAPDGLEAIPASCSDCSVIITPSSTVICLTLMTSPYVSWCYVGFFLKSSIIAVSPDPSSGRY